MTFLTHAALLSVPVKGKHEDLRNLSLSSEAEIRQSRKKDDSMVAAKKYLKAMDALSELEHAMAPFMPSENDLPLHGSRPSQQNAGCSCWRSRAVLTLLKGWILTPCLCSGSSGASAESSVDCSQELPSPLVSHVDHVGEAA